MAGRQGDVFDLNVRALCKTQTTAADYLMDHGGGDIVSVSAMVVNRLQRQPPYNASKAAVDQLTESHGRGVGAPGHPRERVRAGQVITLTLPSSATRYPRELAVTLMYLASDASAFMTGSVVVIDGGYTLY